MRASGRGSESGSVLAHLCSVSGQRRVSVHLEHRIMLHVLVCLLMQHYEAV
jgi:hypothetical protein